MTFDAEVALNSPFVALRVYSLLFKYSKD